MQKTMAFVKVLLFIAFLIVENHAFNENDEITEETAGDMFNCLCVICCDLGKNHFNVHE